MIRTIYKCDKCGNEQKDKNQFWTVKVNVTSGDLPYLGSLVKSIEVCRPCLESFGINVIEKKNAPTPKHPTVEELIREIINMVTE